MQFELSKSLEILERTPVAIEALLAGLSEEWTHRNEGPETWSPYDIVGHLIHGEKTDWIPRMELILSDLPDKTFAPFDRFAQFQESRGKTLLVLLDEFKNLRKQNVEKLRALNPGAGELAVKGVHPVFGEVTLSQLLATWVVHDLNHLAQLSRVLASQYREAVGPWVEYLRVLQW